jgi:site-specific DNA recombinase
MRHLSAWSNGRPAYRCRHGGRTTTSAPSPQQAKNDYVREDRILAQLPALHLLLTRAEAPAARGGGPAGDERYVFADAP